MKRDKRDHADPTFDKALGSVSKEWQYMARLALQIRDGRNNPTWCEEQSQKFTGIFKRLLDDPIDEVRQQAKV